MRDALLCQSPATDLRPRDDDIGFPRAQRILPTAHVSSSLRLATVVSIASPFTALACIDTSILVSMHASAVKGDAMLTTVANRNEELT